MKSKKNILPDNDFEKLVKIKYEREKDKKIIFQESSSLPRETRSMTKLPKHEDKIIDNLKEIQSTLKNKLTFMKEESTK